MRGLTPGPRLFLDESEFAWSLIRSFYILSFASVSINLTFISLFVWMLYHSKIQPTFTRPDIADVGYPLLVWFVCSEVTIQ